MLGNISPELEDPEDGNWKREGIERKKKRDESAREKPIKSPPRLAWEKGVGWLVGWLVGQDKAEGRGIVSEGGKEEERRDLREDGNETKTKDSPNSCLVQDWTTVQYSFPSFSTAFPLPAHFLDCRVKRLFFGGKKAPIIPMPVQVRPTR